MTQLLEGVGSRFNAVFQLAEPLVGKAHTLTVPGGSSVAPQPRLTRGQPILEGLFSPGGRIIQYCLSFQRLSLEPYAGWLIPVLKTTIQATSTNSTTTNTQAIISATAMVSIRRRRRRIAFIGS